MIEHQKHHLQTVTSYGRRAGSARVRVFDWLDWLGVDAQSHTYLDGASNSPAVLARAPHLLLNSELKLRQLASSVGDETLLLSRQASPFSNGRIEARLLGNSARGIYDFDDALMHSPSGRLDKLWSKSRVWRRAVLAADIVIAGNDFLANEASVHSEDVVVIPSCVNPNEYTTKKSYELQSTPRAVWLGSPSTESYLRLVAEPLLALHRMNGLRITVISAGEGNLGSLGPMVDRVAWHPSTFSHHLAAADFGIMPLDDTEWTRGKCAYKLLQYGATGLPMIGSPVGSNAAVLKAAEGLAASSADDWLSAIESILQESTIRRAARGAAGRDAVERSYSFAGWEATFRKAVGLT
ncbi:glycosyltransferase [Cryobacterium sp. M91]|uniref:glycosyltransferase n=1 Tax=Cryobacterium sp. M91 TaxID=2048294 RepID=UPI001304B9A6|nr:glycosyltransferase [Cryobacterium sp. M91]